MKFVFLCLSALAFFALSGCNTGQSRMARGDSLYLRGQYQLALEHYIAAQQKDPTLVGIDSKIRETDIRLYLQRGDEAVQNGKWDIAERSYREVRRIDSTNSEVVDRLRQLSGNRANEHFRRGQKLLGRGNPFDAIAEFEQALTFQPDHPRASESLDRAFKEKHDREADAETAFQDGMRAQSIENLEEAIQYFTSAQNLNPHHPTAEKELRTVKRRYTESLVVKGDAAMARQQWQQAEEIYRKAQGYNARTAGLSQRIRRAQRESRGRKIVAEGNQAFESGDWKAAYERFSQARELTSDQRFIGRYETAREKYAAKIYRLGQEAERDGDPREALAQYKSIARFYQGYRDADGRAENLDVALRTAERAYSSGILAQEARQLFVAREQFRICAEVVSNFRDVGEKSRAVREALAQAEKLYKRGVEAERRNDAERARILFEECLSIATPFRDVANRLARIRDRLIENADTQEQYEKACQAQTTRDLEGAQRLFQACQKSKPGYRDIESRSREVAASLRTAQDIHKRGVQAEEQSNLKRARTLYDECLKVSTPCLDAEERVKRVRLTLQKLEEARKLEGEKRLLEARERYQLVLDQYSALSEARGRVDRIDSTCKQLNDGYEAMLQAQLKGSFSLALSYANDIRKNCVGFKDVDARFLTLECEVDYAEGVALEEKEQYGEAIRLFERCSERQPDFRDVRDRLRACREKASG